MRIVKPRGCGASCIMDDLLAAFPAWRGTWVPDPTFPKGGFWTDPLLRMARSKTELRIDVPDGTDPAAVEAVLAAHDHAAWKAKVEAPAKRRAAAVARLKGNPAMTDLVEALGL